MKLLKVLLTALLGISRTEAKAVFAHFMVGNVPSFTVSDWEGDIALAQASSIDAFALNIASSDSNNAATLVNAFRAANNRGFKLFFSFDYAATGPWDPNAVIALLKQYGNDGAYWKHNGKPFASTFEGPDQSGHWYDIKAQTGCFFVPDYSSYGPQRAVNTGVVDGLFSWDAWPFGANDMSTSSDDSYRAALNGRTYMMPVSPWYFTNLPVWGKNWLWRGDDMWFDRWQQVLALQPEYVQIISWNDYGESHYIGPLHDSEFGFFQYGNAPYNYADKMPHDGWRQFLPYVISQYKTGSASITSEGLVSWYRPNPATACSSGGTTGNSGPNGQPTVPPHTIVQDKVFYSALLASSATVTVSIGGNVQSGTWSSTPSGGSGIYHGSIPFNGFTGEVVVTISRGSTTIARLTGASITTSCTNNIENWNAWVGSAAASSVVGTTSTSSSSTTSTSSTSTTTTKAISSTFSISTSSKIPSTTSTSSATSALSTTTSTLSSSSSPASAASTTSASPSTSTSFITPTSTATTSTSSTSTSSKPTATVCISGRYASDPNMGGLCSFSCNYGYCPAGVCICTEYGPQVPEPARTGVRGYPVVGLNCGYLGLCSFVCDHGYCPSTACSTNPAGAAGCS